MTTKKRFITSLSSIALLACLANDSHAQGAAYTLLDLGILPNKKVDVSTPAALNTQGQVTGTSGGAPVDESAFRFDATQKEPMENIGTMPFNSISHGFGIDASGTVVGDSSFDSKELVTHAAIFRKGSFADLGVLKSAGDYSRANSINASGQVVGYCGAKPASESSRAFIWTSSTGMLDIGTLGGAYAQAFAINDAGFVTGNSQPADGRLRSTHAFLLNSSTAGPRRAMSDLGTLGGLSSYGTSINAQNHVVGYSMMNGSDSRVHGFFYDGGKMRDLGSLGVTVDTDQSFALGINATDEVVGYTYVAGDPAAGIKGEARRVAFIYTQNTMINLNDLIGAAAKSYRLDSATAINDKGQIVANALDYNTGAFHAVLLTPVRFTLPPASLPPVR